MSGSNLSGPLSGRGDSSRLGQDDQALGLTIHSLPSPSVGVVDPRRTATGRWKMLAVLLVCAAPVIASYVTYYMIRPEGRRVFGELVDPQRPLPALRGVDLSGAAVDLRSLKGQWLLVSVSGGACDATCQTHLYLQRQLRESLGRDKDRVDRVWLVNDGAPVPQALRAALRDATVLQVDGAGLGQWLAPAGGHELSEHLYLVDPLGNWMMRFPPGLDKAGAARAKRDVERVLRASASWDNAGRQ